MRNAGACVAPSVYRDYCCDVCVESTLIVGGGEGVWIWGRQSGKSEGWKTKGYAGWLGAPDHRNHKHNSARIS